MFEADSGYNRRRIPFNVSCSGAKIRTGNDAVLTMPTPFSHLAVAQKLLSDPQLPLNYRQLLEQDLGAFLLGNVAADARVGSGAPREQTHFYAYGQHIDVSPWQVMLRQYPELVQPTDAALRAFVAGYVAHLAMDEVWSVQMVVPHFVLRDWDTQVARFFMLHIILIHMDERDFDDLERRKAAYLQDVTPNHWLAFLPDADLAAWQTLIYDQIKADGHSRTLEIFGERIFKSPEELRAILDSPAEMQTRLWQHIPLPTLADVEQQMYDHALRSVCAYLEQAISS